MTQATNTHDRYDLATTGENAREQLSDIIQNISPTDTPFQTAIGRSTAKNTLVEWLGDELAAAASNTSDTIVYPCVSIRSRCSPRESMQRA